MERLNWSLLSVMFCWLLLIVSFKIKLGDFLKGVTQRDLLEVFVRAERKGPKNTVIEFFRLPLVYIKDAINPFHNGCTFML